ncbi:MAG TPA: nucleoside hydrolase [Conexibacter sp.]|nr:nucleoside hydrolase [Conexibacter sp.]
MTEPASAPRPRPTLVDTDTGVDDAVAVALALLEPRLDVVALTTVFGNVDVEKTTANTLALLERLGRAELPLARGAAASLLGRTDFVPFIHGDDGVGNAGFEPPRAEPVAGSAAELIVRTAHEHPGRLVLLALGPLTNLALALQLDPRVAGLVDEVVWMGGTLEAKGNVTPVAEADAHHDPEAAEIVLAAPWPVTVVGLDVTDRALLDAADLARLGAAGTPAGDCLARMLPFYMDFYERRLGVRACAMHSALTTAIAADPGLVTRAAVAPAGIELSGARTRGMLLADRRSDLRADWAEGRTSARIVLDADLDAFRARMLALLCGEAPAPERAAAPAAAHTI